MSGPRPNCQARQCGDEMQCGRCGLTWDVHDPEPPACIPDGYLCIHVTPFRPRQECPFETVDGTETRDEREPELVHYQRQCRDCGEIGFATRHEPAPDTEKPNDQEHGREAIAHLREVIDDE